MQIIVVGVGERASKNDIKDVATSTDTSIVIKNKDDLPQVTAILSGLIGKIVGELISFITVTNVTIIQCISVLCFFANLAEQTTHSIFCLFSSRRTFALKVLQKMFFKNRIQSRTLLQIHWVTCTSLITLVCIVWEPIGDRQTHIHRCTEKQILYHKIMHALDTILLN